nr:hypothetical protein [Tanacetum cinerariifolium]
MLIFGTYQVQVYLSSWFSMKDMEDADVILGIRIENKSNGISIFQSHYIEKAVSQLEYSRVIQVSTPMSTLVSTHMNTMGKLSMYTSNHGTQHWKAIKRVLKYLKKTMDYKLTYTSYPSELQAASKEAEWLRNLILKIPLWSKPIAPISIRCDSAATLAKSYSQMYNGKSRHL